MLGVFVSSTTSLIKKEIHQRKGEGEGCATPVKNCSTRKKLNDGIMALLRFRKNNGSVKCNMRKKMAAVRFVWPCSRFRCGEKLVKINYLIFRRTERRFSEAVCHRLPPCCNCSPKTIFDICWFGSVSIFSTHHRPTSHVISRQMQNENVLLMTRMATSRSKARAYGAINAKKGFHSTFDTFNRNTLFHVVDAFAGRTQKFAAI